MKTIVKLVLVINALLLSATGMAEEAKPLRIGWVFAMANAPAVVAERKGFFTDEGVKVEMVQLNSGPLVQQALAAGELDMAYIGAPPMYHWFSNGLESRILAKVNYGQAAVVVRKDSGINSVADLKGKKIAGVKKGSGMDVLLRGYVLQDTAKLEGDKDVSIITMPSANMVGSVEEKVVDAGFMWEPFISQSLARGNTKVILDINETEPNYPWYVVIARPKAMQERHDDIVKALRAHKKAIDYLNSSPTAGNDIIISAFQIEPVVADDGSSHSAEQIVSDARRRLGWQYELTDRDLAFVQRLMNYSYGLGFIKRELRADEVVDRSYMAAALSGEQPATAAVQRARP